MIMQLVVLLGEQVGYTLAAVGKTTIVQHRPQIPNLFSAKKQGVAAHRRTALFLTA